MTKEEFKSLFDRYYFNCILYTRSLIKHSLYDNIDPQDVVEEVFIQIWKTQPDLSFDIKYHKSFLFSCIRRKVFDVTRRQIHNAKVKREFNYYKLYQNEENVSIEVSVLENLYKSRLLLPAMCRKIFELCWAGYTTEEISSSLNISNQNVLNQKQKAIRILKQTLKPQSI